MSAYLLSRFSRAALSSMGRQFSCFSKNSPFASIRPEVGHLPSVAGIRPECQEDKMNLMKLSVPALAALAIFAAPHVAAAAKLTTVYSFGASGDGAEPSALIDYKNTLYGATVGGGASSSGTLFKLDPHTGLETQLYSFTGAADGAAPYGALLAYKHVFYGTTYGGGANGSGAGGPGTVFRFDPASGLETVLHSFAGPDGSHPFGGLVAIGHYLYGTTFSG